MKKLFTIFSIALIVFSCKRENMDFEGPNLQDLKESVDPFDRFLKEQDLLNKSK